MGLEQYAEILGLIASGTAIFSAVFGGAIWLCKHRNAKPLLLRATIKQNPTMVELKARAMRTNKEMRSAIGKNRADEGTENDFAPPWPYLYVTARNIGAKDQFITGVFVDGLRGDSLPLKSDESSGLPLSPNRERLWKVEVDPALVDRISRIYAVVESGSVCRVSRKHLKEIRKKAISPCRASGS